MSKQTILDLLKENNRQFTNMAQDIWEHPQVAYEEEYASNLQMQTLKEAGFTIQHPINQMETAFIAEYGTGKPIIGILGEYDALPGLSQEASYTKKEVVSGDPGHGCGHNLLGTAGVEAVVALKEAIDKEELTGTIRYYGCPAEEVLSGKTYMAKAGVFDDLDCALTWHPWTRNMVMNTSMQAMVSVKFHFKGTPAHAAASPEAGRSALDSVEIMNIGTNYLREHVVDGTRIHYVITDGGQAPNIVPETASVWYFLRTATKKDAEKLLRRVENIAKGAALINETEVESEVLAFPYDTLPNDALNELMYDNMQETSPITYSEEELEFARRLSETLEAGNVEEPLQTSIAFAKQEEGQSMPGSTDVGDVSWIVPTGIIGTTCAPMGVALHSWQATASFGTEVGYKGMHFAASAMSLSAYELLKNENGIIENAKEEFDRKRKGKTYEPGI